MNTPQPFVLGVNYWPRRKAMYWWRHFDPGEVREEFSVIASLGMQKVRFFLLWEDFQPTPDQVSPQALDNLVQVADIAVENSLTLDVTFFTGHMSGPNWAPPWLLGGPRPKSAWLREIVSNGKLVEGGYRNPFHDPQALAAEELLLHQVVSTLKDHPAIWVWNLGNEPDLFAWPESYQAGQAWVRRMVGAIRAAGATQPVICGLHAASLMEDNGLRIDRVFAETEFGVMHSYPMYSPLARHPLDPDYVPFTCAVTAALCGKPVLMEEFGGCTVGPGEPSQVWEWQSYDLHKKQFMASEEDLAEFLRQTLPRLVQVGALGALVWCYADYAPELWDCPPCKEQRHERFFGLVRPDGNLKPHARVIQEFAATKPMVQPIPSFAQLAVAPQDFYQNPPEQLVRLYRQYLTGLG